ncbi:MAG: class I SAM-dependent methyltransferase [Bacteroidales bacterium]
MQERHIDRKEYFEELSKTSEKYYYPYIKRFMSGNNAISNVVLSVLEIGCGEGGNLLAFARRGWKTVGVDFSENKIVNGTKCFESLGYPISNDITDLQEEGNISKKDKRVSLNVKTVHLIASDIFNIQDFSYKFDLILVHDVIEHIFDKKTFLKNAYSFLKDSGLLFIGYPVWQMPFGGHQQMSKSKFVSHCPFIHLLPQKLYRSLLKIVGEPSNKVKDFIDIKETGIGIEPMLKLVKNADFKILDSKYYFINPHYEVKFHIHPRVLFPIISGIPYFRNIFTTSFHLLLKKK